MAEIFMTEQEKYEIDVPKESRYLNSLSYDYSVQYLYELMKRGKIVLEVPFQRKHIWKNDKASSLLESIIMNVPIPPLYFAEEDDGRWLVLDGLQRLSSIRTFYDNEFSLTKLEVLKELNGKKYKDLPTKSRSLLDDGLLRVNVIKKDSHRDIKYDIFMRLNRGAVTLNYQELRNCMYRSNFNDAAKEICAENREFLEILKQKGPHARYLDVEFVIRCFAFTDNIAVDEDGSVYLKNYRGKMVQYLNEYMEQRMTCTEEEKNHYKWRFNETISKVVSVFGADKAFRDIATGNTKIYKTIADFIMPSFERMPMEYIQQNKDEIYNKLYLFLQDPYIRDSLSIRTSDKDMVNLRLQKWFEVFADAISL
ncbi:MAG: DUF262 domain-containing protein [Clostridiales bacterium]|nr:DUF262 domain-containing protein [Clostridiales bacterium]